MTRSRLFFVLLVSGLGVPLGSCESIAGIPERTLRTDADPCETYCQMSSELCTGEYAIFHNETDCANTCATYSDEELKCRRDELEEIKQSRSNEAPAKCAGASISGGPKKCGGDACHNYCKAMGQVCGEAHPEQGVAYSAADGSNSDECVRQCSVIPNREKMAGRAASENTFDLKKDHEGDTIQCRLVHLTLASTSPKLADEHCAHAYINPQPMGAEGAEQAAYCSTLAGQTAPRCEDYCAIVTAACVDTDEEKAKVYESVAECMGACKAMDPGNLADYMGTNTVACRKYHAYNAVVLGNPTAHCAHAGPGGADLCGDDCDSLCTLLEKGCPDQWQSEFKGTAKTCRDQCKASDAYKKRGGYNIAAAKSGDPFACRLYHAAQSESQGDDNKDACDVAAGIRSCPFGR